MPKSTPGPWRVRSCQTAVLVDVVRNGEAMLIALVADNDTEGDTETDRKLNNARLIAAAPMMLEALERLSSAATAVNQQRHDNPDPVPMFVAIGEMLSAIQQADETIKAAKGEV